MCKRISSTLGVDQPNWPTRISLRLEFDTVRFLGEEF